MTHQNTLGILPVQMHGAAETVLIDFAVLADAGLHRPL